MTLLGAAKEPPIGAVDEQPGKANYFVGSDSSNWRTNIPTYGKVRYDAVYPGIDLIYYGMQRQLEYDFVLAPGADPRTIEIKFDGADRVEIDANGDLVLHACGREIRQRKPVVYQEADGRREIAGAYVRTGKNRIGFKIGAHDHTLPLVIDPLVLSYATYLGGSRIDTAQHVAIDGHGSAYVTGDTYSSDFPVTAGAYQTSAGSGRPAAFIAKFDSAGSLVYSTYLGGARTVAGQGIAVDHDGSAYVTGYVSGDFPTTPGAFQESSAFANDSSIHAFVAKLDSTGSALIYSTLLGGHLPNSDGLFASNRKVSVVTDDSGNAYVTGPAEQTDFPTTPSAFQQPGGLVFVAKLNASGSALIYSARFASGVSQYGDGASSGGIAIDREGNAYVTGTTGNATFPVTPDAFQPTFAGILDAFVTKLGPVGELVYSTYLGGSRGDSGDGIAVDTEGNAYVTGNTLSDFSSAFPITPRAYRTTAGSGFVTKLNQSGSRALYSTFLDGLTGDITVGVGGRAYVAGGDDRFVTIVEPSGSWANASRIQSGSGSVEPRSAGVAVNPAANTNVWVVGYTVSDDFPVTPNAYQPERLSPPNAGYFTGFVAKFAPSTQSIPGTLEAGEFDQGGEGVGYHDNTPGNQGDAGFRTGEDVDVFVSNDTAGGPYIVKNFESGEWLAYTITVPASGHYDIAVRASTAFDTPNPAYRIEIDGANVTGTVVLPDTDGLDHYQWLGKKTVTLMAGTHVLRLVSEQASFDVSAIGVDRAVVSAPYYRAPAAVPGLIEAESFDADGQGIAYHDNAPGNQGDAWFRTGEDVDIFASHDTGSGSWYIVKNFEAGEWLAYTIGVPTSAEYDIDVRAATHPAFPNPAYHVEVDGTNVTGTVILPNTGGWDQYQWLGKTTVSLPAGTHLLKLVSEQAYFDLNTIRVVATTTPPSSRAYFGTPIAVPGVLEAEAFDAGGEGVAYHDNTLGNQGDSGFRDNDSVDTFVTTDAASGSAYIVKNFETGEWLSYTINASAGGTYDVELRASTDSRIPNSAYHIEVDGVDATGTIVLPDTGGWDNYQWLGKRTIGLAHGVHVLTVVVDQQYFDFNALRVLQSTP